MKPGRELDALIMKVVFNGTQHPELPHLWKKEGIESAFMPLENYSEDIGAAWEIVEFIKTLVVKDKDESSYWFTLRYDQHDKKWMAGYQNVWVNYETVDLISEEGISAPHAICLAALKALGVSIENPS